MAFAFALDIRPLDPARWVAELAALAQAIADIRKETYPRFAATLEQMKEEVASVLNEDQAKKWRDAD